MVTRNSTGEGVTQEKNTRNLGTDPVTFSASFIFSSSVIKMCVCRMLLWGYWEMLGMRVLYKVVKGCTCRNPKRMDTSASIGLYNYVKLSWGNNMACTQHLNKKTSITVFIVRIDVERSEVSHMRTHT